MKHPAILIFATLYILNFFIKVPGITELLILPATILFVLGYTIILLVIYFIIFIFSLLISIFSADGERFFLSFAIFLSNVWKTLQLKDAMSFFENLFFDGAVIGVISYIIVGLIYGLIIYGIVNVNNSTSPRDLTKKNKDTDD